MDICGKKKHASGADHQRVQPVEMVFVRKAGRGVQPQVGAAVEQG
jgi:hypothetical protein